MDDLRELASTLSQQQSNEHTMASAAKQPEVTIIKVPQVDVLPSEVKSDSIISSTHLYPFKLTKKAHVRTTQRRASQLAADEEAARGKSTTAAGSMLVVAVQEQTLGEMCLCGLAVGVVVLQAAVYWSLGVKLYLAPDTPSCDTVDKAVYGWAYYLACPLTILYASSRVLANGTECLMFCQIAKKNIAKKQSDASNLALMFYIGLALSVLGSFLVFSAVIATATSATELIANFMALGILSEIDDFVAQVLNVEDPSPDDGTKAAPVTAHGASSKLAWLTGIAFVMIVAISSYWGAYDGSCEINAAPATYPLFSYSATWSGSTNAASLEYAPERTVFGELAMLNLTYATDSRLKPVTIGTGATKRLSDFGMRFPFYGELYYRNDSLTVSAVTNIILTSQCYIVCTKLKPRQTLSVVDISYFFHTTGGFFRSADTGSCFAFWQFIIVQRTSSCGCLLIFCAGQV
jgi:hypothetical protein